MKQKKKEKPYIIKIRKVVEREKLYNPRYGDDRVCICGHNYHRHFDGYENNRAVGCKYCECYDFKEAPPMPIDKNSKLPMNEQLNEYHRKLETDYRNKFSEDFR